MPGKTIKRKLSLFTVAALAGCIGAITWTGTSMAMSPKTMPSLCAECHQAENNVIRGTIVPGSQTDSSVKVQVGNDVWNVKYDHESDLDTMATVRDLRDDKAVRVQFADEKDGWVYAEEISYKPGYHFKNPDDIITINEVVELLKKTPEEGNYAIIDARGYDNYIEGHLPNAVMVPYYRLQAFQDRLPKDKNTQLVAYCRGYG